MPPFKEQLQKLPPEERIKKLREREQKLKEALVEGEKRLRESEEEITERKKWLEKVPIPQIAKEDWKGLSLEEKEILKAHQGLKEKKEEEEGTEEKPLKERSLEETLARESAPSFPLGINPEYALHLSKEPVKDLYQEMDHLQKTVEEKGYINVEEERRVQYLSAAVERKLEDARAGRYSLTEETAMAASVTRQIGAKLREIYRR